MPPGHSTQPKSELTVTASKVFCAQQFQKHATASLGFNRINPFESVIEPDFQTIPHERLHCFNPNHALIRFQ